MTDYQDISDNEIRIIGADNAPVTPVTQSADSGDGNNDDGRRRNNWKWFALALVIIIIVALSVILTIVHTNNKRIVVEDIVDTVQVDSDKVQTAEPKANMKAQITVKEDSINDIPLIIFTPEGCKVSLQVGKIDSLDKHIYLCAQAADVRSDNGEIVSAYVLKGEPLSRGIAKKGFCAILKGAITIGMAEETPLYERVVEEEGDFFRQYPLVHDSKMQENKPKGKAIRNALCILKGKICIIHSAERESFHDFAQALQDYGVTEAIALTGANATLFMHNDEGELQSYGAFDTRYRNTNYIVFRE